MRSDVFFGNFVIGGKGTQVHSTMAYLFLWEMPFMTKQDKMNMAFAAFDFFNNEIFLSQLYRNFKFNTGTFDKNHKNYAKDLLGITIPDELDNGDIDLDHCCIDLNFKHLGTRDLLIGTVAHEMCHFATMLIDRYDDPQIECHEHPPYQAWRWEILNAFPFLDFDDDHHGYPIVIID